MGLCLHAALKKKCITCSIVKTESHKGKRVKSTILCRWQHGNSVLPNCWITYCTALSENSFRYLRNTISLNEVTKNSKYKGPSQGYPLEVFSPVCFLALFDGQIPPGSHHWNSPIWKRIYRITSHPVTFWLISELWFTWNELSQKSDKVL